MKKFLSFFVVMAIVALAAAQTFPNYSISIESTSWQSIASSGTRLTQVYNTYEQTIQLPFDLEFGGATILQGQNVKVSARGRVNLGTYGAYNYAYTHWNSPSGEFAIIPFFTGMVEMPRNTSSVYWLTRADDRGGQELVVEWNGLRRYGASGDNVSYQLHIHSNGDIAVCYGPMTLQAGYWDTVFTFAVVHDNANDRILTTGNWNTDSSIVLANPSQIGSTPLMHGTPQSGQLLTLVRPLPPCPHPTHLAVTDVWQTGATLTWTGNGVSGAQYIVQYGIQDFTPGVYGYPSVSVSDTTYTIGGLLPNQQYYAYVRSDCGPDTSRWESLQFQTPCEAMTHADLPYEQHFESNAEAACWRKLGSVNWSSQQNVSGTVIRFCNMHFLDSWAIMPPVDWVSDLQVSFRVTNGPVMVGVMDNPYDTASFVPLHECTSNAAAWQSYTVRLSRYDGSGQYVAFRTWPNQYGVGGCLIDDVVLDTIQGCIAVENLRVSRRSATTADLLWADYDSVGHYRVVWTDGITSDTLVATNQGCTLTGLSPETQYSVSVRILCDSLTAGPDTTIQFSTYATCVKPLAVTVDSITRFTVRVHWTDPNSPGTYRVLLRTSPGSDTISVDTVVADTVFHLTALTSVRRYLVEVRQLCSGTWTDYEWDTFENDYSCAGPQGVTVDTVFSTSAVVHIADTLAADHCIVLQAGMQSDTLYVTDSIVTITGLQPATRYTIGVSTRCTDNTFSRFLSATFATPCSIVTHTDLPYVMDFDNTVAGSMATLSPCWTVTSFAPSNIVGLYRPDGGQYHGTSGNSLYAICQQPDWPVFIALPEFDSLADLALTMWVYCSWAGDSKLDIGIMSDPSDSSTFHLVDTYIPAVARQWVEVSASLRGHGAYGHYPALRVGIANGTMGDALYIDDVVIALDLSCSRPDSLSVLSLSDTSALLAIHPASDADSDAVAYQVVVSSSFGSDTLIVIDTLVHLGGLRPATDYTVGVRSFCPEGGITLATTVQFVTLCGERRLPWTEDFELQPLYRMPRCWELADSLSARPDIRTTPIVAHSGTRILTAIFSGLGRFSAFTTPMMAPTDAPLVLSYYARGFESMGLNDTVPIALRVDFVTDSDSVKLFEDKVLYAEWTLCQHVVPQGLPTQGGRFLFRASHMDDSAWHSAYLMLDDVSVSVACLPVTSLEVLTADTVPSGIEVRWQPQGTESAWQLHLWSDVTDTVFTVTTTTVQLAGLAPLTDYCVEVQPLCDSAAVMPDSVKTDTVCFTTPDAPASITTPAERLVLSLHPNPASGIVNIACDATEGTIEVLDMMGRTLLSLPATRRTLDVSSLPSGSYFVRLATSGGTVVGRLVVM